MTLYQSMGTMFSISKPIDLLDSLELSKYCMSKLVDMALEKIIESPTLNMIFSGTNFNCRAQY